MLVEPELTAAAITLAAYGGRKLDANKVADIKYKYERKKDWQGLADALRKYTRKESVRELRAELQIDNGWWEGHWRSLTRRKVMAKKKKAVKKTAKTAKTGKVKETAREWTIRQVLAGKSDAEIIKGANKMFADNSADPALRIRIVKRQIRTGKIPARHKALMKDAKPVKTKAKKKAAPKRKAPVKKKK